MDLCRRCRDNFTLFKNVNKTTNINIVAGNPVTLTASWKGNYQWSTGASAQSVTVNPSVNTIYTVKDINNCITDTFNVAVSASGLAKVYPVQAD